MIRRAHWPRPVWVGLAWTTGTEIVDHDAPNDGGGPMGRRMSMPNRSRFIGAVPVAMVEEKPGPMLSLSVDRDRARIGVNR